MAIAELNTIDSRLTALYESQITTNTNTAKNYEDRSELLYDNMQMIAYNNKMFLKLN